MSAIIAPVAATSNVQALQPVQAIAVVAARLGDGAAQQVLLQPGTIVQAQVADIGAAGQVKIALAGVMIDALSDIPLTLGAPLRLAVSQANDGVVRLSIVPMSDARMSDAPATLVVEGGAGARNANAASGDVGQSNSARMGQAGAASPNVTQALAVSPEAAERQAIAQTLMQAMQNAAPRQQSFAPLFANVAALVQVNALPFSVQQAAVALLGLRMKSGDGLNAEQLRQAMARSGIFLESNLAAQARNPSAATQASMPDMKAALLVLRETLAIWRDDAEMQALTSPQTKPVDDEQPSVSTSASPTTARADGEKQFLRVASPPLAAGNAIASEEGASLRSALADMPAQSDALAQGFELAARKHAGIRLDAMQALLIDSDDAATALLHATLPHRNAPAPGGQVPAADYRSSPPPLRAGALSAQSVALPTLAGDEAPLAIAHHLLDETDGALARQTLLQVASLPDANDPAPRVETAPRWQFEIPFVTQQGTAMAHFEVSRDAPEQQTEASAPIWRVRFSIAVEPAGPVHVSVVYNGERTHVRMWAERDETATRLRDQSGVLAQALRNADLDPGDIIVGEGAPPRPRKARPSGVFLDRAT